jgi:hypothetical protein
MKRKPNKRAPRTTPSLKETERALAVVRLLDERLLAAAVDPLDENQKSALLEWAHRHLMAVVIYMYLHIDDPRVVQNKPPSDVNFSLSRIDIINSVLCGNSGIDKNLTFPCLRPSSDAWSHTDAMVNEEITLVPDARVPSKELTGWLHERLIQSAQQSRRHSEEEINELLKATDAELIICSLNSYDLARQLEIQFPHSGSCGASVVIMAAMGHLSIQWDSRGPVYRAVKPLPGLSDRLADPTGISSTDDTRGKTNFDRLIANASEKRLREALRVALEGLDEYAVSNADLESALVAAKVREMTEGEKKAAFGRLSRGRG